MKLLIVRHGDPDYENDSLTEKGWREAEYLSDRLSNLEIKAMYVSPLGRAKDTASLTLKKLGRTAEEMEWLREFRPQIIKPDDPEKESITWDWLPRDWTADERFYHYDEWYKTETMQNGDVKKEYDWVNDNLDLLLKKYGYEREGHLYKAVEPNNDTIILFCHFGVQCVMLSHLFEISPMNLWHGMCAAPSSVTMLVTEERCEGTAYFRMGSFGDVSHLYANNEPVSFSARFCECYTNYGERH